MQCISGERNGKYYEFVYLEPLDQIIVWKGDVNESGQIINLKQVYIITIHRNPKSVSLNCNCPAGRYRKHCEHERFCGLSFQFFERFEPQSWMERIGEEYLIEWLKIQKEGFYGEKVVLGSS